MVVLSQSTVRTSIGGVSVDVLLDGMSSRPSPSKSERVGPWPLRGAPDPATR
jgi:hypothetical protein